MFQKKVRKIIFLYHGSWQFLASSLCSVLEVSEMCPTFPKSIEHRVFVQFFFATVWGTKSDVKVSKMGVQWPQNGAFGGQKWAKSGPKRSPKGSMEKHLKKYPKNVVLARFWAPCDQNAPQILPNRGQMASKWCLWEPKVSQKWTKADS